MKPTQNIMVSISLLETAAGDLLSLGLPEIFRTRAEQAALTARYEQAAAKRTPSLDVDRLGRTDRAGNRQKDGGYQIFTSDGQRHVTPENLQGDLEQHGFRLAVVEIFRAEGHDGFFKLRLTWSKNSSANFTATRKQARVLGKYLGLYYFKLFGFRNAEAISLEKDGPIRGPITTLNFSGVMNAQKIQQAEEIREVRLTDSSGHLACPLIRRPEKTKQDPFIEEWQPGQRQRCPERTPERLIKNPLPLHEVVEQAFTPRKGD